MNVPARLLLLTILTLFSTGCPPGSTVEIAGQGGQTFRGRGVPWSILCMELSGPYAKSSIDHVARVLRQVPGVNPGDVFTTEGREGTVRLFYGTYDVVKDTRSGRHVFPPTMGRDVKMLKELTSETGEHYFIYARKVPAPQPDVGNPAWLLSQAPGVYSLQVASFVPVDDYPAFKEAAAAYCARLRGDGHQAYYWHSEDVSIVTVGSFGEDAVIEARQVVPPRMGARTSRGSYVEGTRYSEAVLALQRNELFKYNYVNGHLHQFRFRDGVTSPPRSQLVRIPRPGGGPP